MNHEQWADSYWKAVADQEENTLRSFFAPEACILWHNTNERFTVEEFLRANCEYPGKWAGEVERAEQTGTLLITAVRVWSQDGTASFHAVSFFHLEQGLIQRLDEYWGDDGTPPQWRREKKIGRPIR